MLAERLPTVGLVGTIFQLCCLFGIHVIRQQSKSSLSQALRGFSLSEKSHLKTEIKEPVVMMGFPGGTVVKKNLPANAADTGHVGSIPGLGRSTGVGDGNPLQHSCLEKSTDRGAWWATVHGVTKSQTQLGD